MTDARGPEEAARYVRVNGLITAGEGLDMDADELEVLIGSVHDVLEQLGFHLMLNWQIVFGSGSTTIAATGPRYEERAD